MEPSRFGSVVAHPDLNGEVSGSSPGHTKDFRNGTYCSSTFAGNNELEYKGNASAIKRHSSYLIQWTSRQRCYNLKSWLSDNIKGYKTYGPL